MLTTTAKTGSIHPPIPDAQQIFPVAESQLIPGGSRPKESETATPAHNPRAVPMRRRVDCAAGVFIHSPRCTPVSRSP